MRRSSIGLPPRPSTSPPFFRGDVPFDDDDMILDEGGDPESPRSPSKLPQTPRRVGTSSVFQDGEDSGRLNLRSKSEMGARNGDQGEDVEDEIAQGVQDVEMQQEDGHEEVTPTKDPAEKRKRKKKVLAEIPRKNPFAMPQFYVDFSSSISGKYNWAPKR